jgi:hypothetical protein
MRRRILFVYVVFAGLGFTFSNCSGNGEGEGDRLDSLLMDTMNLDSISPLDTVSVDSAGYINEEAALTSNIEKKYGVQWDFCDCVVKNDSIEKAIMATDDEKQLDKIIARSEIVDQHCKGLLTTPNTTPEQRDKHERKVKKCLRDARK